MRIRILGVRDDKVLFDYRYKYSYQMFIKLEEFLKATLDDYPFYEVIQFRFQIIREVSDSEIAFDFTPNKLEL